MELKMGKTDPALKTWNWSGLVCKIDVTVIILTLVFIVPSYFMVILHWHFTLRSDYFDSSLKKDIEVSAVCGKVAEAASTQPCKHSIVNFQELEQ